MHRKSAALGAGLAVVIMSVLCYFFYSFQFQKLQKEFEQVYSNEVSNSGQSDRVESPWGSETSPPVQAVAPVSAPELSDEEIISRAVDLGMAFLPERVSEEASASPGTYAENEETLVITVRLVAGMVASDVTNELYDAGVIEDSEGFLKFLTDNNATRILRAGDYSFPGNADYEKILQILLSGI